MSDHTADHATDTTDSSDGEDSTGVDPSADTADERWIADAPVLETPLPDDVQILLGRLLGDGPIETLGAWVAAVRRRTGGGAISLEALCHTDQASPHHGDVGDERYHFRCFYDAVVLAALVDDPVDIRTESPTGHVIHAAAVGTDRLRVTPASAVFSFGVADAVDPPVDGGPSTGDVYDAICPFVQAFRDRDAYERWADDAPAATVALPLDGATDVASALAE